MFEPLVKQLIHWFTNNVISLVQSRVVKLKVAKKTTAGCCLHEAIAGLFLKPGIDTIVCSLSSFIFQTSVFRF